MNNEAPEEPIQDADQQGNNPETEDRTLADTLPDPVTEVTEAENSSAEVKLPEPAPIDHDVSMSGPSCSPCDPSPETPSLIETSPLMNSSPSQPRDQESKPYIRPQVESSPQSPFVLRYNPDQKRPGPTDYT